MSKAILEFDLPEEEHEFKRATQGRELAGVLWHVDNLCRSILKHRNISDETFKVVEEIRDEIPYSLLEE